MIQNGSIPRYAVRTLRFYASVIGINVFDVGYALRTAAAIGIKVTIASFYTNPYRHPVTKAQYLL